MRFKKEFGLVGTQGCGKTVFVAILVRQFQRGTVAGWDVRLGKGGDEIQRAIKDLTQGKWPGATPQHQAFEMELFIGKPRVEKGKNKKDVKDWYKFKILDISGEHIQHIFEYPWRANKDKLKKDIKALKSTERKFMMGIHQYIINCDGYICIIDPDLPKINEDSTAGAGFTEALEAQYRNFIERIREYKCVGMGGKINIPVMISFAKMDMYMKYDDLRHLNVRDFVRNKMPSVNTCVNSCIEPEKFEYFPVSACRGTPEKPILPLTPYRITDPIIHLMEKL